MKKIAIFNVGGALSAYLEFDDKKIMIDLGSGNDFSPIDNFLLPLASKRSFEKAKEKYKIDQLFLSHLDKDHISDYEKFRDNFYPVYMTCPNDNDNENTNREKQDDSFKVNVELLGEENPIRNLVLGDMRSERAPKSANMPLVSACENVSLYYIKPGFCENSDELKGNYANNISLVLLIQFNEKNLLLPGDILKEGMDYLLNNCELKNRLNNDGLDFLIAPHHGLQTAFSEVLFQEMKGNKTRLNIISEKLREADSEENRSDVDGRYYSSDYSTGGNTLKQNAVKTSGGHIIIDFTTDETEVRIIDNTKDLIQEFV